MTRLLHRVLAQGIEPGYVQRLLAVSSTDVTPSTNGQELVEPLSDRELQVLRLLTTHLSNAEIGAQLFVSVNTVRFHVRNIYAKLNVHARGDAVQRAQELGLL
jgi:LuxR family maltose regulon positive regulatory protein